MKNLMSLILLIAVSSFTLFGQKQKPKPPVAGDSALLHAQPVLVRWIPVTDTLVVRDSLPVLTDSTNFLDLKTMNQFKGIIDDLFVNPKFYAEKKPMEQRDILRTNLDILLENRYKDWLNKMKKVIEKNK